MKQSTKRFEIQYPHLAKRLAHVFGGYDSVDDYLIGHNLFEDITIPRGIDLAIVEVACATYAEKFDNWGGVPFRGDVPQYDALLKTDKGVKQLQKIITAND